MAFNDAAWGNDGLTYDADDMRTLVATLTGGVGGVAGDVTAAKVSQQTVAATTVKVAEGALVIPATGAGLLGSYHDFNDGDLTSPVFSPTSANGRKDRLIVRVTAGVTALEVVQGTAAASPTEPAITGDNFLELALITLPVSTTNITDAMITDRRVFVARAVDLVTQAGVWTAFTPTWRLGANAITVGNGTNTGRYRRIGVNVEFYAKLIVGSTTSFPANDTFTMDLPVAAQDGSTAARPIGTGRGLDASPAANSVAFAEIAISANRIGFFSAALAYYTGTSPWTWATGDSLFATGSYEAA